MNTNYDQDETHIKQYLHQHNLSVDIIKQCVVLLKPIRKEHLNLDYLAISSYILISNFMKIDVAYIKKVRSILLNSVTDQELSDRTLYRYCLHIIYVHEQTHNKY